MALNAIGAAYDPWPLRKQRTQELGARYDFAAEVLSFYAALLEVQARAFHAAQARPPAREQLPAYVAASVLPDVVDVTVNAGPRLLADGTVELFASADLEEMIGGWLNGEEQSPVATYLARASAGPVQEALAPSSRESSASERDDRHCPSCGGPPQLAFFGVSDDALLTPPRRLLCARCGSTWIFQRMTCAGCGEQDTSRLPIYQEGERFPHLRVDGCQSCRRYLITVDCRKDTRAVPIVDELAAIPLDLYARDQGLTKITANLLGF
jgi:formate dehydrogenase maturation protein FdhE